MHLYQLLYVMALLGAIAEIFTMTLILLGFALGCFVVGLTQQLSQTTNFNRDVLIFSIASTLFIVLLRKVFARKKDFDLNDGDINQY